MLDMFSILVSHVLNQDKVSSWIDIGDFSRQDPPDKGRRTLQGCTLINDPKRHQRSPSVHPQMLAHPVRCSGAYQ